MRNIETYEYIVFYYDMDEVAKLAILKDLYSHKLKGADGKDTTDDALSVQEMDVINPFIRDAADKVSELIGRWMRPFSMEGYDPLTGDSGTPYYPNIYGINGYEFGKQSIDPDNDTAGNYIVYRVYFPDPQQRTKKYIAEIMPSVDSAIQRYLVAYIRYEWAELTGQATIMQTAAIAKRAAEDDIIMRMTFRHTPQLRTYHNF